MKNTLVFILLLSFFSVAAQPKRTTEQTERLDAKNGFRTYVLGTPLSYFANKIDKRVEEARIHSKLYKFKNEDLNISKTIRAEWIIYQFTLDKLDEISVKIKTGSKEFLDFLLREYGEPETQPSQNSENKAQFYQWKGKQAYIQLYYTEGKEGATFIVSSGEPKTKDNDIRQGF